MLALETDGLTKDYLVGFWRPRPYRALDQLTLQVGPGRGLRLPRSQRRRQEHRHQAADAADLPDQRPRPNSRPAGRRLRCETTHRLPAREPDLLRLSDRRGVARLLRPAVRHAGRRARGRGSRPCWTRSAWATERRLRLRTYSKGMVQRVGIAQAILNRARHRLLRRADVRPRSARPPRRPPAHARLARSRLHGVLQLAHPVGRRGAVQPGRHRRAGKLVAGGRLAELLAFELQGWELVVGDVSDALLGPLSAAGPTRHGARPRPLHRGAAARCARRGAARAGGRRRTACVSLNPMRDTLESYFVVRTWPRPPARDTAQL